MCPTVVSNENQSPRGDLVPRPLPFPLQPLLCGQSHPPPSVLHSCAPVCPPFLNSSRRFMYPMPSKVCGLRAKQKNSKKDSVPGPGPELSLVILTHLTQLNFMCTFFRMDDTIRVDTASWMRPTQPVT